MESRIFELVYGLFGSLEREKSRGEYRGGE